MSAPKLSVTRGLLVSAASLSLFSSIWFGWPAVVVFLFLVAIFLATGPSRR